MSVFIQEKNSYAIRDVYHPTSGDVRNCLVHVGTGLPVLKKSETLAVVQKIYEDTKGEGAKKLAKRLQQNVVGVSGHNQIQEELNSLKVKQTTQPKFCNKRILHPIEEKEVMHRNQIDLENFQKMPVTKDFVTYRYVLSVLDVMSRYLMLRPLSDKSAQCVADELNKLYSLFGPPVIVQSDQGKEFTAQLVQNLMKSLGVRMIFGSPYYPQSQGKDERSHQTWKQKVKYDITTSGGVFHDWVSELPTYMMIYNESPHSSLGMKTPLRCFLLGAPTDVNSRVWAQIL
eukprot:m.267105 g.267105  ORF g.267105 m.267105 type:complete len:286 (+) comp40508_c1_seq30:569-1426(+)